MLAAARPEDVLRHDLHHIARPLPAHHHGRVAQLGDAAHAMPPTLGQGGNQVIEDAIALAHHRDALAGCTAARLRRTAAVTGRAVKAARLNTMTSGVGVAVRDNALAAPSKAAPALLLRGFDGIGDRRPPQQPYASLRTTAGNG